MGIDQLLTHVVALVGGGIGLRFVDLLRKREQSGPAAETERAEITARQRTHEVDTAASERRIAALETKVDQLRDETIAAARESARIEGEHIEEISQLRGAVEGFRRKVGELEARVEQLTEDLARSEARAEHLARENERLRRGGS